VLLNALDGLSAQQKVLDKQTAAVAKQDDVCRRLMTIPGVGVVTALAYKAAIDDPRRFK